MPGDRRVDATVDDIDEDELVRRLTLVAYPDRVCRRRAGDGRAGVMVGGVGVRLDPASAVHAGEFFVAVDARQDDRSRHREAAVRIASGIKPSWLESLFPQSINTVRTARYDEDRGRVVAIVETKYLDLVLRQETRTDLPREEAGRLLAAALAGELPAMIAADDGLATLINRLRFAAQCTPKREWPVIDASVLADAAAGKRSRDEARAGLLSAVRDRLVYPLDRLLEQVAPEAVTVPTGSRISLQYNADPQQPPVLAVRLQEVFGLSETPRVGGGRVPVLLHLLGPNYRPVQITSDLASFWANVYQRVRKDLRADYPRHSWPDDPLTAPAVRGARRRGT